MVKDASLSVRRHEVLGLVGESGSGKTQTAMTILGLTRPPGRVLGARWSLMVRMWWGWGRRGLRRIRGKKAAMIFQSPRTSSIRS